LTLAIRELVQDSRLTTKARVEFSTKGAAISVPPDVAEDLVRIVQQAVDNASQHAQANVIHVELAFKEKQARLQIKDDGRGFEVKKASHGFGLASMHARAKEIGGKLKMQSRLGRGTLVEVTVPVSSPHKPRAST
jgi:signal transduction histidine kinase